MTKAERRAELVRQLAVYQTMIGSATEKAEQDFYQSMIDIINAAIQWLDEN